MKTSSKLLTTLVTALVTCGALVCFAPPQPNPISSRVLSPYISYLNGGGPLGTFGGPDILPDNSGNGIKLASVQHSITQPFDSASGNVSSTRRHSPLTIVKQLDATSLKFQQAIAQGVTLPQVVIRFYGSTATNAAVTNIFTYTLLNARVVAIRNWQPNANDPASAPYVHPEEISFVYETIRWRDELSGNEYEEDWANQTL